LAEDRLIERPWMCVDAVNYPAASAMFRPDDCRVMGPKILKIAFAAVERDLCIARRFETKISRLNLKQQLIPRYIDDFALQSV
jgi:hypothetical protein